MSNLKNQLPVLARAEIGKGRSAGLLVVQARKRGKKVDLICDGLRLLERFKNCLINLRTHLKE
jgi:hypothetical protein